MITQISYNVIIERFKAFAAGHFLIKGFTHGDPSNVNIEKGVEFPWMHVFPVEVAPQSGSRLYSFIITFADLPRDKETPPEYQREVLSDCIRLAEDLLAEIQNGLTVFGPTVEIDGAANIEVFINEYSHTLTGVNLALTLSVPWDWSACDIPADWSIGGTGSGGSGIGVGLILRVNGTDNIQQDLLDLVDGDNVTITDLGNGSVRIDATGGTPTISWGDIIGTLANQTDLATALGLKANSADLGAVAFSNDYNDLDNLPTIPTLTSELTNDNGFITIGDVPTQVNADWNAVSGVAEILNKPTIPAAQVNSDWNASSGLAQILNKPTIPTNLDDLADVNTPTPTNLQVLTYNTATGKWIASTPSSGSGTVTSVGLTMPTAFSVASSPVTTSGTIAVTGAGSGSQYIKGDGTLATFPIIPAAQIQSDWNQSNNAALDFIKNKPTINAGTVTSVGTAGLISGGTITGSGTITTSMTTNKLVGRFTAATGIMEEVTIGSGLTLTGAGVLNNSATPTPTGYYGAFQDSTSQTAASINTAYAVKFNTTDLSNGVTIVNDGSSNPTRITLANTGIYNIQFSLQMEKTGGSGNMIADIWIRKNGVDVPSTTGKIVLTGSANASPVVAAWNYVLDLVAGDYVQLMWSTSNINVEIVAASATAPHPSIPSSILTVTQQAGIMSGTGITAINSLTGAVQTIGVGTSGTDFAVSSAGTAHTLNLPTASATNRGALSNTDWSTFNGKQDSIGLTTVGTNLATLTNPSAIRYIRINADNSVTALTLAQLKTDLSISSNLTVVLGSNVTNVGTALEDITAFSFAVSANKTYRFRTTILYARTSGTGYFSVNGPTFAANGMSYRFTQPGTATTNQFNNQIAYNGGTSATLASGGIVIGEGIIKTTASGTVIMRMQCSAGTSLTIQSGSFIEYSEIA
jgi:hypothetical protein